MGSSKMLLPSPGTSTAGTPVPIPEFCDIIVWAAGLGPVTLSLQFRNPPGGEKSLGSITVVGGTGYTTTQFATNYFRADGRVFSAVWNAGGGLPFFFLPHDAENPSS